MVMATPTGVAQTRLVHLMHSASGAAPDSTSKNRVSPTDAFAGGLTSLVGRDTEIVDIRKLLDMEGTRLVTLTGPGGIGKTRLAMAVVASLATDFASGARMVSLVSTSDAALVPVEIAQVMGITPTGIESVEDALIASLRDKHLLLLLDNLEHLLDGAAPWISTLLSKCPRLHVLATSRAPLRISGEQRFSVQPLGLPETESGCLDELVRESAAVQMFIDRARSVRPDIGLSNGRAVDVAEICRTLEGVPLAIELAASRVAAMSLAALRARLADRLTLLSGGNRDAPVRHQAMRSAIAWSYDLLSEPQRKLFRRLSVFAGGFTVQAAEAMGDRGADDVATIDLLQSLIEHSLIRLAHADRGGDRFEMLETIRAFSLEVLTSSDEEVAARTAHAGYFLDFAASLDLAVRSARPAERGEALAAFHERLEAERGNLHAALDWLYRQRRIDDAIALAVTIWPFHGSRGHDLVARATLENLIAQPELGVTNLERGHALLAIGNFARSQGEIRRSEEACRGALAVYCGLGDERHAARALFSLGWVTMDAGRLDEALGHYRESLDLASAAGDMDAVADAHDLMGLQFLERNAYDDAMTHFQAALEACRATGERARLGNVLSHLGLLMMRLDEPDRAEQYLSEAVVIAREVGDRHLLPTALIHHADLLRRRGEIEAVDSQLLEALAITRETGYVHGGAFALTALASQALSCGRLDEALRLLRESVMMFQRVGLHFAAQYSSAFCFDVYACFAMRAGESVTAARFLGMSDGIFARNGIPRPIGPVIFIDHHLIASIRSALRDPHVAVAWLEGHALDEDAIVAESLAFDLHADFEFTSAVESELEAHGLSGRELEVLRLLAEGLTNQEIADTLFISRRTAASHVDHILEKLDVRSRTAAVAYAIRNGLA